MIIALYKLKNTGEMHYFYLHDYQGHFFSPYTLTSIWGRNFSIGREKSYTFNTQAEMDAKVRELFNEKLISGYKLLYTYPPSSELASDDKKEKVS